jgi:PfaD family protein
LEVRQALLALDRAYELPIADPSGAGRRFILPATPLTALGDASFAADHGLRFNYMGGAMANGIASVELVIALARAGCLGAYGAAGQAPAVVAAAVDALQRELPDAPFAVNLIHSPAEPAVEAEVARLLIAKGVRLVEASAFLGVTLPLVRYRVHGLRRAASGRVIAPNHIIAKVSRVEIARQFFAPPPPPLVAQLVAEGAISAEQAAMAREIPLAQDVTADADSGGHTDNRPLIGLVPTLLALRDRLQDEHAYAAPLRVGAAGGIATPAAVAAAFAAGAAYVVTGSVNQACRESGASDLVRAMLAKAGPADVAMAPAADMFEMGVKVQVLKQGTMFPMRAAKLYELYGKYRTLDELPARDRELIETQLFRQGLDAVWAETKAYFTVRDPRQVARGEADPRHRMALVFRSYLGQSSHWANQGVEDRRFDFQVWCGPAMGAFNEWVKGSFLEDAAERRVGTVARNLLVGAAVRARGNILLAQGAPASAVPCGWRPLPDAELQALLEGGAA